MGAGEGSACCAKGLQLELPPQLVHITFHNRAGGRGVEDGGTTDATLTDLTWQFQYGIVRTPNENHCWEGLLPRCKRADMDADGEVSGLVICREIAVHVSADASYALPSKSAIKSSAMQTLGLEVPVHEVTTS